MGYSSRQEFERVFPRESGPPTREKKKNTDIEDSARKWPANSLYNEAPINKISPRAQRYPKKKTGKQS